MENPGELLDTIQRLLEYVLEDVATQLTRQVADSLDDPGMQRRPPKLFLRSGCSIPYISRTQLGRPVELSRKARIKVRFKRSIFKDLIQTHPLKRIRLQYGMHPKFPKIVPTFLTKWRLLHSNKDPGTYTLISRFPLSGKRVYAILVSLAVQKAFQEHPSPEHWTPLSWLNVIADRICCAADVSAHLVRKLVSYSCQQNPFKPAALNDETTTVTKLEVELNDLALRALEDIPTPEDCEMLAMLVNRISSEYWLTDISEDGLSGVFECSGQYSLSRLFPLRSESQQKVEYEIWTRASVKEIVSWYDDEWLAILRQQVREAQLYHWFTKSEGARTYWAIESLSLDTEGFDVNYGLPQCLASDIYSIKHHFGYHLFPGETLPSKYTYGFDKCTERLNIVRQSKKIRFVTVESSNDLDRSLSGMSSPHSDTGASTNDSIHPLSSSKATDELQTASLDTIEIQHFPQGASKWLTGEVFMKAPISCVGKTLYTIFAFGLQSLDEEFLAQYSPSVFWNVHLLCCENKQSTFKENMVRCMRAFEEDKDEFAGSGFQRRAHNLVTEFIRNNSYSQSRRVRRSSLISEELLPGYPHQEAEEPLDTKSTPESTGIPVTRSLTPPPVVVNEAEELRQQEIEYTRNIQLQTLQRVINYYSRSRPRRYFLPTRIRHRNCNVLDCPLRKPTSDGGRKTADLLKKLSSVNHSAEVASQDTQDNTWAIDREREPVIVTYMENDVAIDPIETYELIGSENWKAFCLLEDIEKIDSGGQTAPILTQPNSEEEFRKIIDFIVRIDPDRREDLMSAARGVSPHHPERFKTLSLLLDVCLKPESRDQCIRELLDQLPRLEEENLKNYEDYKKQTLQAGTSVRLSAASRRRKTGLNEKMYDEDGYPLRHVPTCSTQSRDQMLQIAVINGYNAPVIVGVNEKGRGIYAAATIYKGDFVCEYKGDTCTTPALIKQCENKWDRLQRGSFIFYYKHPDNGRTFAVDATSEKIIYGWARLINHSHLHPNLEICLVRITEASKSRFALAFKAARDIRTGEELLIDYGERRKQVIQKNPWLIAS